MGGNIVLSLFFLTWLDKNFNFVFEFRLYIKNTKNKLFIYFVFLFSVGLLNLRSQIKGSVCQPIDVTERSRSCVAWAGFEPVTLGRCSR